MFENQEKLNHHKVNQPIRPSRPGLTNRTIFETLELGWKLLDIFPNPTRQLKRIDQKHIPGNGDCNVERIRIKFKLRRIYDMGEVYFPEIHFLFKPFLYIIIKA